MPNAALPMAATPATPRSDRLGVTTQVAAFLAGQRAKPAVVQHQLTRGHDSKNLSLVFIVLVLVVVLGLWIRRTRTSTTTRTIVSGRCLCCEIAAL